MEPQIQYAKTSDGVSIAYYAIGSGPPLVHTSIAYSHVQMEWEIPEFRAWYEQLATRYTLIRYDMRGTGLSQRGVRDFSVEGLERDMEAVVDRLDLERFAVMGLLHGAPVAIAYAAEHPERVSRLVLWCGYARASDWWEVPQVKAIRASISQDWETGSETIAHTLLGWAAGDAARHYAALVREGITRDELDVWIETYNQLDVADKLSRISAPTLVLQRSHVPGPRAEAARELASAVPDARLMVLDGASLAPQLEDSETVLRAIYGFLSEDESSGPPAWLPSGTAVILCADIVDSTALGEKLGDATFRERSRVLEERLRGQIKAHAGIPVEGRTLGDGVLATFGSASGAIGAALACARAGDEVGLALHLGLHAGDVIREKANVYGQAVSIASRVGALSGPNEVLVSATVRDLARASTDVVFEDRGEHALKGVSDPVRVYEVRGSSQD